jgi:hypothetical protein
VFISYATRGDISHSQELIDQGDLPGAKRIWQESLALHRKLGGKRGLGYSLWALGLLSLAEGDLQAATFLSEEVRLGDADVGEADAGG